jgi:diaminopimelate epimerase
MQLNFTKMHGLGNDFMVIDQIRQDFEPSPEQIRHWSDRHRGIGFDQCLLVSRPTRDDCEFRYRIFNSDGSEVEQCGNGARCFARFVHDQQLTRSREIPVQTAKGRILLILEENGAVTVNMGAPVFEPAQIPLLAPEDRVVHLFTVQGDTFPLACLSMGNPHGVMQVLDVSSAPVANLGPALEKHPSFPNKANIGFMQVLDRQHLRLRVFERGVGETLACGTGACAAAVAAIRQGLTDNTVNVALPGGNLRIHWSGDASPVLMTGPATSVFEGTVSL